MGQSSPHLQGCQVCGVDLSCAHRAPSCYPPYQNPRAKVKPHGIGDAQMTEMEPADIMIFGVIRRIPLLGYQGILHKDNPKEINVFNVLDSGNFKNREEAKFVSKWASGHLQPPPSPLLPRPQREVGAHSPICSKFMGTHQMLIAESFGPVLFLLAYFLSQDEGEQCAKVQTPFCHLL